MSILLDDYDGEYDLTASWKVADHTMAAAGDVRLNVWVGTDAKPCVAIAGEWSLYIYVLRSGASNQHVIEPYPQNILASSAQRKLFVSKVMDLNAGDAIRVWLYSPNGGDTSVGVHTEVIHVTGALPAVVPNTVGGLPVLDANSLVNVDVERLAGVVQSLTDLKHFADSGYDPDTSKVNGVKLVDTTTTNTDMLAAAGVKTAIEAAGSHLALILADTGTDGVALADGAITAAKFNQTDAFPLAQVDADSTAVARTGADSDTLEKLSDQLDAGAYT